MCQALSQREGWERSFLPHLAVCFMGTLHLPKMPVQNSVLLPSQRPALNSAASVKITHAQESLLGSGLGVAGAGLWGLGTAAATQLVFSVRVGGALCLFPYQ